MSILCAAIVLSLAPQTGSGAGVLAKHVEALKAAKALTVSFTVENLPAAPENYKLSYAKPNKLRIETPTGMLMTDGKTVWEYNKKTNEYTEQPGDMKELGKQIQKTEYAAWAAFFLPDQMKGVKDAAITGKRSMKGNPVTQVDFTIDAARSFTASFYVDDKMGIARGASFKAVRGGDKTEVVVKATEIVVGDSIDEGLYAFSAPAGSKKVEISVSDMAKWYDDLDEGLKVAKATNRMVFLDFGAVW
jgi:outer membrane lipoprotein-sorting protein